MPQDFLTLSQVPRWARMKQFTLPGKNQVTLSSTVNNSLIICCFYCFLGALQPSTVVCLARATVNFPSGAGLEMVDPAPMVAP